MFKNAARAGCLKAAALLLWFHGLGCSASQIPIIGSFAPSPGQAAMEDMQKNQKDMMLQYTFRPAWKNLVDDKKFKSALAYIDAHKQEMSETSQKTYTDETVNGSKTYLNSRLVRFRGNLSDLRSHKDAAAMKTEEFVSNFQMPPEDELLQTTPAYAWAKARYGELEDFRARKPSGETLFKGVAEAGSLPADEDGEYRWFDTIENLAFIAARDYIRGEADKSQDASNAERDEAQKRAVAVRNKWTYFVVQGLPEGSKFRSKAGDHDLEMGKLIDAFPKDLPELEKIDISGCLTADNPEAALRTAEKQLKALESRAGISKESRQKLYTMIVTVVSLRTFLQGKEEIDALGELRGYGDKLSKVGGPTDARAFGARVQKVFDALR